MIPEILNVYDMTETNDLSRFLEAQLNSYETALEEIQNGRKRSHWMWYVFPQLRGLGFTDTSKYYAIKDLQEAEMYLAHPILGQRLVQISTALLELETSDAHRVFGSPDDLKLRSSMTLFAQVDHGNSVFEQVLEKFFNGAQDEKTLVLLEKAREIIKTPQKKNDP